MKENKKSITERIDNLEKKISVMMSMINHINEQLSNIVLNKIEFDIDDAVNKKFEYLKNNKD